LVLSRETTGIDERTPAEEFYFAGAAIPAIRGDPV
jgi:hypothetical protein